MEGTCIVSSCGKAASKCCGSCGVIRYCSVECQKEDWKKHHKKEECVNMKKLSDVTLTENELSSVANKLSCMCGRLKTIREGWRIIHLLREFIDFVRNRLGRLDRKDSRSLIGDLIISSLLINLGDVYFEMQRSFENDSHVISYMSEARELLMQMRDTGMDEIDIAQMLMSCDKCLYRIYDRRGQMEKAKYHAEQCVATARGYNGEDKIDRLKDALSFLCQFYVRECKYLEALAVAEEAYTIASKQYSPSHKMVLRASNQMINCLIVMGDYSTADTYSRMNYSNYMDPMNAGEYDDSTGMDVMNQLVLIWLMKEPDEDEIVEKALADEAMDLSRKSYALSRCSMRYMLVCLSTFYRVLFKTNQLTEETEGILHEYVIGSIAENNSFGNSMCELFQDLFIFYIKLHESLPLGEERILVQENIELCQNKLLELESCNDGSVGYIKGSLKIQPYFKNNVVLCI